MEETLGKKLFKTREAAGISIDDAVYLAKIPRAVVEALEADNYGFFTSPLYARSFLKQYGEYVGVDVAPWLDDLVPTSMIDGETVESYIDIAESPSHVITPQKTKSGGGAMAAVWMLLITGILVWGGIKGMEVLDKKLSSPVVSESPEEGKSPAEKVAQPPIPKATDNDPESAKIAKETTPPDEKPVASTAAEPPRRAIVVPEE